MSTFNPYSPSQFFLTQQSLPDPGAGNEATFPIPEGYTYEMLSLAFEFNADANVAVRRISLELENQTGVILFSSTLQDTIAANDTVLLRFGAGFAPRNPLAGIFPAELSWPTDLLIPGANVIAIRVTNIQVGDTITLIRFIAKQWYST